MGRLCQIKFYLDVNDDGEFWTNYLAHIAFDSLSPTIG